MKKEKLSMEKTELDGIYLVRKKLQRIYADISAAVEHEKEKRGTALFILKGEKIHTEKDIYEMYECDMITSSEYDKARNKLDEILENKVPIKSKKEYARDFLAKILQDIYNEVEQLEYEQLTPREKQEQMMKLESDLELLHEKQEKEGNIYV